MFTLLDRVRDTSTTTGTGTITVSGVAPATFFAFSTLGVGASFDYVIAHRTANEVEVGRGTRVSGTTFSRDLVLRSSNGNALVSFSAGTKDVFLTMAAASLTQLDEMMQVFSPMRYGAIGDGVADDSAALAAVLAAAEAQVTSMGGGNIIRVVVDLEGRRYATSDQLGITGGVRVINGGIKAIIGGSLSATVPLITLGSTGIGQGLGNAVLDCNFLCSGLLCDGPDDALVFDVKIRAFNGYGLKHGHGSHGCCYVSVVCNEWGFNTAGYDDQSLRVAIGFDIQGGDFELVAPRASYCAINLRISRLDEPGNLAGIVGVVTGGHFVQGSSAISDIPNIVILQAGQTRFQGTYIDNGPVHILGKFGAHSFMGCTFLRAADKSSVRTGFQLYATAADETGDGLQIINTSFDATWLEAVEFLTDGGTWSDAKTCHIYGNLAPDGLDLSPTDSRMVWPTGSVATPGLSPSGSPRQGFYSGDVGDLFGYASNGTKRLGLQAGGFLQVGDHGRSAGVVLDALAGDQCLVRYKIDDVLVWDAQVSADGNYNVSRYAAGVLVNRAFEIAADDGAHTMRGALTFAPKTTAATLAADGQVTFERSSNAQLAVLMRGTDDVTNRYVLPLSVAGNSQKTICSETVLHIGPSYTARMTPFFSIDPDTWSRTSGVGTFHTENDAVDWIVGHKFRIQDTSNEWVEGQFTVLTNTPATSPPRSVITYADARANKVSGDLVGNGIAACDLQAWSCASGVPAYVSIAMGGNVRYITLGTNGTGVVGWMLPERQAQIRAIGPVGTVVIDGGSVGGSVNDDGLSGDDAYEALRDFIEFIRPQCNSVWAGTPPPYGAVAVNSAIYAAGTVLVHRMQNLAREYPFVKIIPFAEALTTRYGIVDSTELLSGLQPPNDLCTDGVHDQEGAAAAKGAIIGHCLMRDFRPRYPLGGNYPDNRIVASGTDVGGRKNPNLLTGWFGAVSTNAASGSGISGTKPTSGDLTGTAWTGTATAISSVVVNPDGGSDWVVGFGSPTTSPGTNTRFTMAWTGGRSAGELLTAVNTAANKGKEIDIWVDCGVGGFEPGGVTYVDLALWLTTAADGEWRQASGLSPEGDYQAVEQNKAMLTGINGRIRFPRTVLPNKTYTAAEFRLTVKPTQGTTGRNLGARARIGPSFRLEVVELVE